MNQPVSAPWCVFFLPTGSIPFSRLESGHSLWLRITSFIWELYTWTRMNRCDMLWFFLGKIWHQNFQISAFFWASDDGFRCVVHIIQESKETCAGKASTFPWMKYISMHGYCNINSFILIYGICNVTITNCNTQKTPETTTIVTSILGSCIWWKICSTLHRLFKAALSRLGKYVPSSSELHYSGRRHGGTKPARGS